jgi:hypothetical protein
MNGWRDVHVGFANDGLLIEDIDVWRHKWRKVGLPALELPHPAYPNQLDYFDVYEIGAPRTPVRFAAGELSAGVWGFYVPA